MEQNHAPVGELVLCPTPIGNPQDLTLRAMQVLAEADVIACEDTRRTGLLLAEHDLGSGHAPLFSLHEHNERERASELLQRVRAGAKVVLVSDAGMPLISDPGFALVRSAIEEGLSVRALPGASSVPVALAVSGLPAARFAFEGFLPRGRRELERLLARNGATLVAFESPRRLSSSLAVLAELDPDRKVAVCRELSKLHEEILRGSAATLASHFASNPALGEIVLVVEAAPKGEADSSAAVAAVRELVAAGARPREAARCIGRLTGMSANALYELALDSLRSP